MLVRLVGEEPPLPGLMSRTRVVPAAEPSLFHSSVPVGPSLAVKNTRPATATRLAGFDPAVFARRLISVIRVAAGTRRSSRCSRIRRAGLSVALRREGLRAFLDSGERRQEFARSCNHWGLAMFFDPSGVESR